MVITKDKDSAPAALGETDAELALVAEHFARVVPLLDLSTWDDALALAAAPHLLMESRDAVEATIEQLPKPSIAPDLFDVVDRNLPKVVKAQALKFSQSTNETTSKELTEALEDLRGEMLAGITTGDTRTAMRNRVMTVFEDLDKDRAMLIAHTESTRARHDAQLMTATESGVCSGKSWLASADACFAAGSLVFKQCDTGIRAVGIETIKEGDFVVGGSGGICRVLRTASRFHDGPVVHGPGFIATPTHEFLCADGRWRPIGQYAGQANVGSLFDFRVIESKDVPSALLQITSLPLVLPCDLGFGMPIHPIAENDELPFRDDKVDEPSAIHFNLLGKRNTVSLKNRLHGDLNISAIGSPAMVESGGACLGAAVGLPPVGRRNAGWIFRKVLSAVGALAPYPILAGEVTRNLHSFAMSLVRTLAGTINYSAICAGDPFSLKFATAHNTARFDESGDFRIRPKRHGLALSTAKLRAPCDASLVDGIQFPASRTGNRYLRFSGDSVASMAAKSCTPSLLEWFSARLARDEFRCLDGRYDGPIARGRAELPLAPLVDFAKDISAALATSNIIHRSILPYLRAQSNSLHGYVYDIEVEDDHCFLLPCGLVAHNCPKCLELSAMGEIPLDQPFTVTTYGPVNGPPLHPSCFCSQTLGLKTPEEIDAAGIANAGKSVIQKDNPNHGQDGRFTSISGGNGGISTIGDGGLPGGDQPWSTGGFGRLNKPPTISGATGLIIDADTPDMIGKKPGRVIKPSEMKVGDKVRVGTGAGGSGSNEIVKINSKNVVLRGTDFISGNVRDFNVRKHSITHVIRGDSVHPIDGHAEFDDYEPVKSVKAEMRDESGRWTSSGGGALSEISDDVASHVNDIYNGSIELADGLAKKVDGDYRSAVESVANIPSKFSDKYEELNNATPGKENESAAGAYSHAIDGIPDHVLATLPDSLEDDLSGQIIDNGEVDDLNGVELARTADANGLPDAVISNAWDHQEDIEKIEPAESELKDHWKDQLESRGRLATGSISASIGPDSDAAMAAHAIDTAIEKLPATHADKVSDMREELIDHLASSGEVTPEHFKNFRLRILQKMRRKDAAHAPAGSPQGGQFVSSGGAGAAAAPNRLTSIIEAPINAEHAIKHAVTASAKKAISYVGEIWKGGGTPSVIADSIVKAGGLAGKIADKVKLIGKVAAKTAYVTWIAGNKAVENVARAKRLEEARDSHGQWTAGGLGAASSVVEDAEGAIEDRSAVRSRRAGTGEMHAAIREGSGKDAKIVMSDGSALPAHVTVGMIPPAYSHNIQISKDANADVWAMSEDAEGNAKRVYNPKFEQANQDIKWGRVRSGEGEIGGIRDQIQSDRAGKNVNEADAAWLMTEQGTRPGSEEDTKGNAASWDKPVTKDNFIIGQTKKGEPTVALRLDGQTEETQTPIRDKGAKDEILSRLQSGAPLENAGYWLKSHGATTLEGRHVVPTIDGGAKLQFMGKEGVWHDHQIADPKLAKTLLDRKAKAGPGGSLFGTDYAKTAKYVGGLGSGKFSPKDLRTIKANEMTSGLLGTEGREFHSEKERKSAIMDVATKVSRVLGNRPQQALSTYIDPTKFDHWKVKS